MWADTLHKTIYEEPDGLVSHSSTNLRNARPWLESSLKFRGREGVAGQDRGREGASELTPGPTVFLTTFTICLLLLLLEYCRNRTTSGKYKIIDYADARTVNLSSAGRRTRTPMRMVPRLLRDSSFPRLGTAEFLPIDPCD